jgi:spermidine synthase
MNTESLPYWPINPSISTSPWYTLQLDLVRAFWVVLPGAVLWGASFPLALAAVASTDQDSARLAGGVYAANTVGAILGSLVVSFLFVPWIGTSHSQQVLIVVSAISADARTVMRRRRSGRKKRNVGATVLLAGAMVVADLLARSVHPAALVAWPVRGDAHRPGRHHSPAKD